MEKKRIHFIEKQNKPLFEVELLMEYMYDDIYKKIEEDYIKNKIDDIILIDHRLDMWRHKLIGCKYLKDGYIINSKSYIYTFNKKTLKANYGFFFKVENNDILFKGKYRVYKSNMNECYIFYNEIKTEKKKKNDNIKNILNNILNNKIKIKKLK